MLGNEQHNNQTEERLHSSRAKIDITDYLAKYKDSKKAKNYINVYLRAISIEEISETQGTITVDSLEGRDNIETLCEYIFERVNNKFTYSSTYEPYIRGLYNYQHAINENIRKPIEDISLEKLYNKIKEIVQNNTNLDKDEVIKQVMKGIYGGKLDVCRYGEKAIYERNLYKRFVITDKFVSSRNGDVSKEERNEFEAWLKPKELDLSKTDSYIDKYNEEKQLNNNPMQTNELGQSSTSSRKRTHSSTHEYDWNKKQRNIENDSTRVDSAKVQEGSQTSQNSQENNLTLKPINNISMMTNNLDQASTSKSAVYNGKKAQKTILPSTAINSEERGERGNPIEFNIVNVYLSRYKSEANKKQRKKIIKAYLRVIFPEVTNDTQRAITEDSLVGKDNIETLCEFVFKDINLGKKYFQTKEASISSFYNHLNSKNKNIRNPIEYISLERLYTEVGKIVQNNNNLDKDEVIKQVMEGIYEGRLDVCRQGEKAILYERNLYKRFVITDKFVSSRNGDVSKEERNEFEAWLKPKELDLSKTDSYIDKYNEEKQLNNNSTKVQEGSQTSQNSQENNLELQEITLEVPFLANNNLIQITAYKIPNTDVIVDCHNVQLIRDENRNICDRKGAELFLNNDGHLVTREGYYPIPITHPFAAIIGKHGYTMGPLGDEKLPLCFAPNENAVQFWEGTYKQPILLCVDRNGIYDSLDNKIIVEKGQDGKIRITYPNEEAAYEKIQKRIQSLTQYSSLPFNNSPKRSNGLKQASTSNQLQNIKGNCQALQPIKLVVPPLVGNNLISITAYKIPNTDVIVDCHNVQLIRDENRNICDRKGAELFLNNDGHLVTREGYYPIPITHPFAAIIGKYGYTTGPLGDKKLLLHFAPNENAVQFWEGTYKQPILLCVDRNGIYDSLDNKIIVEKGQDGKIRITYPNEEAAYEEIKKRIQSLTQYSSLQASTSNQLQNIQENCQALQPIKLVVPSLVGNYLIQITAYKIPNTDVIVDCHNVQLIRDENRIICDRNGAELFLNKDGHLVTREGYYPIPITHPFAAIIGKHGYTMGPLGDEKLPLCFAPNENAVQFWEGTYKQPILICVDRNGIYDSLDNKIIVEKGQDGKIRITYSNEEAAYEKIQSMIANQGNDGVFINGPVPTYGMNPYNTSSSDTFERIQRWQNYNNPTMQNFDPYAASTSTRFVQHNNG